jgi:hypothetical protein
VRAIGVILDRGSAVRGVRTATPKDSDASHPGALAPVEGERVSAG